MQAKNEAARIEHNQRAWMAWHIAAFQRAKKMPSLRSITIKQRPPVQSWQQQFSVMEGWAEVRRKALEGERHG